MIIALLINSRALAKNSLESACILVCEKICNFMYYLFKQISVLPRNSVKTYTNALKKSCILSIFLFSTSCRLFMEFLGSILICLNKYLNYLKTIKF